MASLICVMSAHHLAAAVMFHGLGYLPGYSSYSTASAVSADGSTVIGASTLYTWSGMSEHGFRWTSAAGMEDLGTLPGKEFSYPWAVNRDGSTIVGGSPGEQGGEAFRWTQNLGMQSLGYLGANAVSADGSVVAGWTSASSGIQALRWTADTGMQGLGFLPGGSLTSEARGISADGSIIVGYSYTPDGHEAFHWTQAGGMQGLGHLPDAGQVYSEAWAISADGSTIVGYSFSDLGSYFAHQAFRWTAEQGMKGLGVLPLEGYVQSFATAVSADGSTIVGRVDRILSSEYENIEDSYAFIWDAEHGMRNLRDVLVNDLHLDLDGRILIQASGISADGLTIVGLGVNSSNQAEAWIAVIPEPLTLQLLAMGALALVWPRKPRPR